MLLLSIITFGIYWLVVPFIYNKKYIIFLLEKGYKPATKTDRSILINKCIIAADVA